MAPTADVVFFAIRAALRLSTAARKAYADATLDRELILPLPQGGKVTTSSARAFFVTDPVGKEIRLRIGNSRLEHFLEKEINDLTHEEAQEFIQIYLVLWSTANTGTGESRSDDPISVDELGSILTIRQWSKSAPSEHTQPLQTVAGTLVNIAVDYFLGTPGVVSEHRPEGRAIKTFLEAIDATDFSTVPVSDLAPGLFVALLDGVSANPDLLLKGPKEKEFVTAVTKTLSASVQARFADATSWEQARLAAMDWPGLIARSFFIGGAELVMAHPTTYLGARVGAESSVVSAVVESLVNLVVDDSGVALGLALSGQGLETLVHASLSAVADNPEILKADNKGVEAMLRQLVDELAASKLPVAADSLPEIARLVLSKTAANLPTIWGSKESDPASNLAMIATSELLEALSAAGTSSANGQWRPSLSQAQLSTVLETVLDELLENPRWVSGRIAGNERRNLRLALDAVLAALAHQQGDRVSMETGVRTIKAGLAAAALNLDLLESLPTGAGGDVEVALTSTIDVVLSTLLDPGADQSTAWVTARTSVISALIEVALDWIARRGANEAQIATLRAELAKVALGETHPDDLAANLASTANA